MRTEPIKDYVCQHCGFQKATHTITGSFRIPFGAANPNKKYIPIGEWDDGPDDEIRKYECGLCDFCYKETEPLLKSIEDMAKGQLYRILIVMTSPRRIEKVDNDA